MSNIFSPITYKLIKGYRDRYITPPVDRADFEKDLIQDADKASEIIIGALSSDKPIMISRFGATELNATLNYKKRHPLTFLRRIYPFWIGERTKKNMMDLSGFFPSNDKTLSQFSDLIYRITSDIDILGTWIGNENLMPLPKECIKIFLPRIEPFWSKTPWTKCLEGKKIVVIHPFAESISQQYNKRELLFANKDILPEFASLTVIKAVQSLGGETNGFASWFDALHYMEDEIDKVDYDVALIGCGAYGMPLAAHCKKMGKKAVHLGGSLQLLFGIRGNRWETEQDIYMQFMNEHWVRPLECEKPAGAQNVEKACYW